MKTTDQLIDIIINNYNIINNDIKEVFRMIMRCDKTTFDSSKRRIDKTITNLMLKNKENSNILIKNLRDMEHEAKNMQIIGAKKR